LHCRFILNGIRDQVSVLRKMLCDDIYLFLHFCRIKEIYNDIIYLLVRLLSPQELLFTNKDDKLYLPAKKDVSLYGMIASAKLCGAIFF